MKRKLVAPARPQVQKVEGRNFTLYRGDALDVLRLQPDNSVDSCIVDGPYGLEFMGSDWDGAGNFAAGIEKDAKSAGGYGKDKPTNENAYAAARVRYGKLFSERPKKIERRSQGHDRPFDMALPDFTSGMRGSGAFIYLEWSMTWAREVLRVLKPGGFLMSFGGSRTYHLMACGVHFAGFEVRDMVEWLYGSGFPKTQNVARAIDMHLCRKSGRTGRHYEVNLPEPKKRKPGDHVCDRTKEGMEWEGYGTALKPAHEPICMARKPITGALAPNVLKNGTGGLDIDSCRIGREHVPGWHKSGANGSGGYRGTSTFRIREMDAKEIQERNSKGGWPNNVITDEEAAKMLEGKARFFYCPKPSKREKDAGLDEFAERAWVQWQTANGTSGVASSLSAGRNTKRKNVHPTIKPVAFMRYLVELVTPEGGTVLDHFCGSGSTGVGTLAAGGGRKFIGAEQYATDEKPYFQIACARLHHAEKALSGSEVPRSAPAIRGRRRRLAVH
jgi:DNA modification methylase